MFSCISYLTRLPTRSQFIQQVKYLHISEINEAARRGTREKARKKKVKVEVKKVGFIPHNQRGSKLNVKLQNKHIDDSWKSTSTDNVWVGRYCKWPVYSVQEAIAGHRDTHHPSMYNEPNAPLFVDIELYMQGEKKTRFVDNFNRMAAIPNRFDHGEDRQIMVLAKGQDHLQTATDAGATLVGGPELIKSLQTGDINLSDYPYVLAHPNIMPELIALRGILKRKFPNPKNGSLGVDVADMVKKFMNGIHYQAKKDEQQQDFGIITTTIGTLNMDSKHLEENLSSLLNDVNMMRPRRDGRFVTRVLLKSPPSQEIFKIDPFVYISEERDKKDKTIAADEDDDDQDQAVSIHQ